MHHVAMTHSEKRVLCASVYVHYPVLALDHFPACVEIQIAFLILVPVKSAIHLYISVGV